MTDDIKRYLIYTFSFSWIFWGILIGLVKMNITTFGTPLAMVFFICGGIMPAIIGISLKKIYRSNEEFSVYIKNIVNPKHHLGWYI